MDWHDIDWPALTRLRQKFLEGAAGATDYWESESDLASYDLTFAQRIGWKWDHVLSELRSRGWRPRADEALDWGCGSGIAGRAFIDCYGAEAVRRLSLWDRSPRAVQFATERARKRFPGLTVAQADCSEPFSGVLLLSHVLTELDAAGLEALLQRARVAEAVLWVEPGTFDASQQLSRIRDQLCGQFNIIAPCTHREACPIFAPGNEAHWCHHFAKPPPDVFTDGRWARFSELVGVDLRSLPLSYLVLDRQPLAAPDGEMFRLLGRPRIYKAHAEVLACSERGLREYRLTKRRLPELFRQAKKGEMNSLQSWKCDADEITSVGPA